MAALTSTAHWDRRRGKLRSSPPSRLNVAVRDIGRLLSPHIAAGSKVIEIGCSPGKYLLLCSELGATVSGLDYAPASIEVTRDLFRRAEVPIDLRQEDAFQTTFAPNSFDLVYSIGLIEHYTGDDLRKLVAKHIELAKPGRTALFIIPNFSGIYGRLLRLLNEELYSMHNVGIMRPKKLKESLPDGQTGNAYIYGSFNLWIVSLQDAIAPRLAQAIGWAANLAGLLQPVQIDALCPWVVLSAKKTP